jgi:hypothetical protein
MKKPGETVTLGGKVYTVDGFDKRSYILKDATGKKYKCSPAKLDRMENGVQQSRPGPAVRYFEQQIAMSKIFGKQLAMPDSGNALAWIAKIYGELSPEALTCDGELSRTRIEAKRRELNSALAFCEKILGRQVSESEAYQYTDAQPLP